MSPWMKTGEACEYLRYEGKHRLRSLYRFLKKQGIPTARRDGTILIARADLDKALGVAHRRSSIGLRSEHAGLDQQVNELGDGQR